jgi:hypothetical protein
MSLAFCQVYASHIQIFLKNFPYVYIQVLCQSRLCKTDRDCLTYTWTTGGSLSYLTALSLTATKFKPHAISTCMSGFALSYAANMFILMILYDFCLLPAQFCYIIVYIWRLKALCKSRAGVHLVKFPVVRRTVFCRRWNFKMWVGWGKIVPVLN